MGSAKSLLKIGMYVCPCLCVCARKGGVSAGEWDAVDRGFCFSMPSPSLWPPWHRGMGLSNECWGPAPQPVGNLRVRLSLGARCQSWRMVLAYLRIVLTESSASGFFQYQIRGCSFSKEAIFIEARSIPSHSHIQLDSTLDFVT